MLSSNDADWSRPGIIDDHAYFDDPGRPSFSDRSLCVVEKPNWSILAIAAERRAFRDFHRRIRECKVSVQHNMCYAEKKFAMKIVPSLEIEKL